MLQPSWMGIHLGSFIQTTPASCYPPCSTCPGLLTFDCSLPSQVHKETEELKGASLKCGWSKSRARPLDRAHYHVLSDSEEDYDHRERVPTVRPGQYNGTTPWKEFLHRFESCAA